MPAGEFSAKFEAIVSNVARVLHGKEAPTRLAVLCLLSRGHLLLEDVPGVGKTSLAKALAASVGLECRRIQFTPDLLPSDITGTSVFDRTSATFSFRPGPLFANVVIGDEINRASPKTQSALLEAMQERQVTVDSSTHRLPEPFLVIATQNPAEHEGTYPLPESQLDRFLLRVRLGYPGRQAELAMLDSSGTELAPEQLSAVMDQQDLSEMLECAARVHLAAPVREYVVDLASATRNHPALELGMSPRCSLALTRAAQVLAASQGRDFALPDDVKALFIPVVSHRVVLSPEAVVTGVDLPEVLSEILRTVPVPAGRPASG